jgi:hypothetical protein
MLVQMGEQHAKQIGTATSDGNEYTLGGWTIGQSGLAIASRKGFISGGWVTKPIKYHPPGNVNSPYSTVDSFGFPKINFFDVTQYYGSDPTKTGRVCFDDPVYCVETYTGFNPGQNTCYQNMNASGTGNGGWAPMSQGTLQANYTPRWIRGATDGTGNDDNNNTIWCLPAFPVNNGTLGTHDTRALFDTANIGPEMPGGDGVTITSNTWTNGENPHYPIFPYATAAASGMSSNPSWYYQLVYDPDHLVGYSKDPTTGIITLPSCLWKTALLQQYFSDKTITKMRYTYCSWQLHADVTGASLDPKCWGYLSIKYKQWSFIPNAVVAGNYTPIGSCLAGSYFDIATYTCVPCPSGQTSAAGATSCHT